jgi:hypothetical protein
MLNIHYTCLCNYFYPFGFKPSISFIYSYAYNAPPMCFYLVVVVGLVCANDSESYVGGSVATGRVSQAEQVEG